ncbi:MAG: bifunctional folylpolyglutamate synthase/dihydrofolate synthase, partial [Oscillospiraceae bacterium]|nr:bifunctional folylpolyglutamate synthase/dihydrofolate synthase [Oscillospiraceae bacterium]
MYSHCEAMDFINGFTKLGSPVKDLSRFKSLMSALGNPQDRLKFIHIAGTNGKGSTARFCAEALTQAGYKVGEYTSPYITDYTDRIRINGKNIPKRLSLIHI